MHVRLRTPSASRPALVAFGVVALLSSSAAAQDTIVPPGASWSYLDDGSDQGTGWTDADFDDSSWDTGAAQLGYGDGDETTLVSFGPDPNDKYVTTYYRHEFDVADPSRYLSVRLELVRDDGAVVHLNGNELTRSNMPAGTVDYLTLASSTVGGASESAFHVTTFSPTLLNTGANTLAVEIHQRSATSSDTSFDLRLLGFIEPYVDRGPFLQRRTGTEITVSWRTVGATDSVVWLGPSPGTLAPHTVGTSNVSKHDVVVQGLTADTQYHYGVGTLTQIQSGGDADHTFRTAPVTGSTQPLRLWVIGDSGTADHNAAAVRDAYLAWPGALDTDIWLMLGDNAYNTGQNVEYQAAIFEMYPQLLKRTTVWPTRGNHDVTGAYFGIFTMPTAGEVGGAPSGTENYYSFDQGNIHFVCLDSWSSDRAVGGPMYNWLQADLSAADQEWLIAYWHHPPYTKGSHNSDTETELVQMRANFLPLLEAHGVDLVLCGHSHSYERSVLIDGHYGTSATWDPSSMELDGGDGDPLGDGAYEKFALPHEGAVYAVAGSSGKLSNGPLDHPVMTVSLLELGSMVIDVSDKTLDAVFLDGSGVVRDSFRIVHGPIGTWDDLGGGSPGIAGTPALTGAGALVGGEPFSIGLVDAAPSAVALLILSLTSTPTPAFGGTLHTLPILELNVLGTDASGTFSGAGSWPSGVPPGTELYYQFAIADASTPWGIALSNGLRSTTP